LRPPLARPPGQRPLIRHVWSQASPPLRCYVLGVLGVIAYATVAVYIGLGLIPGIPHAVFLALLTGLLEMIPMIGPRAAAVIAGLVAVRYANGIGPIIGYAVYATILRLSIDQILGPLAVGAAARVHPATVIFLLPRGRSAVRNRWGHSGAAGTPRHQDYSGNPI